MATIKLYPNDFLRAVGGSDDVFVKSRKFMRGSGLFASLGSFISPILKRLSQYAISRGSDFMRDTSAGLAEGKNFKDSFKSAGKRTVTRLGEDFRKFRGGKITKRKKKSNKTRDVFARLLK